MKRKHSEKDEHQTNSNEKILSEINISANEKSEYTIEEEIVSPPRRVTRSSLNKTDYSTKDSSNSKTKNTADPNKKISIPISKCPYIEFLGEIKYFTTNDEIVSTCKSILDIIETTLKDTEVIPMAFDMEWPFNFKTGPGKSSVIQVSIDENICYVFSIANLTKIPCELIELLMHPKVVLHGVNIKNDFRKLQRDFPDVNSDLFVEKCKDLGTMYNEIRNTTGRWSLEKLVNKLCRLQIDKSVKIRMSKWDVIPLEEHQLKYAAIDVHIGQVIYNKLESIRIEKLITKENNETEVITSNEVNLANN